MRNYNNSSEQIKDAVIVSLAWSEEGSVPCRLVIHPSMGQDGEWVCHYQNMTDGSYFWGAYGSFNHVMTVYASRCTDCQAETDMINSPAFKKQAPALDLDRIISELERALDQVNKCAGEIESSVDDLQCDAADIESAIDALKEIKD